MAVDDKKSRTPKESTAAAANAREAGGRSRRQPPHADATPEELQRALAELQVHRHELELQNEELRSVQESLDLASARYRDLFEYAPVGYFTLTDEAVIQEVNRTAAGLLSCPMEALVGKPFHLRVAPDCRSLFHEHFSQHRRGRGKREVELRMLKTGHQDIWVRLVTRRSQMAGGRMEFRVVISDISELHETMRTLHDTQLDLRRAQEMARIGLWRITHRGAVILCSDETYRILGLPVGSEVSQDLLLTLEHPEDRAQVAAHRADAVHGRPYDIEHRLLVDGRLIWVREKAEPRMDDNRRRPDVFGTIQDISDVKAIEQSLRDAHAHLQQSEARYRAVVEDQAEMIARFRADGTLAFANPAFCKTFGPNAQSLLGQRWQPLVVEEDLPLVEAQLATLSPAHPIVRIENRYYDSLRQVRWGQFVNRGLFDEAGKLVEFQSVGRDVTEQKEVEAQLRRTSAIIQSSPDIIAIASPGGKLEYMNRAGRAQLGLTADEPLKNYEIEDFHAPEVYRKIMEDYIPAAQAAGFWRGENVFRHLTGREFPVLQLITAHRRLESDDIEFVATIVREITVEKARESALKDSEAKFSAAFMECPLGMAIIRLRDNCCVEINRRMLEIYELRLEEALGKTSEDLNFWDEPSLRTEVYKRLQAEGTVRNIEASFTLASGKKRILLGSIHVIELSQEPHALVIVNDVTQKRQTETSLRTLQNELQMILDTLPAHIFYKDCEDRLLRVNSTVAQAWGRPKDEIEGRRLDELFPNQALEFRQIDEAVIASGKPLLGFENVIRLPSGEERWMSTDLVPRKEPDGRVSGLLVMATDITTRKRTEQELQLSRDDLNRAQSVGKIGNWRLDGKAGSLIWSAQTYHMFGVEPGTPMDYADLLARLSPEEADRLDDTWLQALARRGPYEIDYRVEVNGEWRWLREKGELEFDADGDFIDAFGTVQDISELKAAEAALLKEDRLKDEFLATLAHELRNPLAPLRNGFRVLQKSKGDPDMCGRVLALMEPQLLHMVRLLDDLLDMSRIRQGRIELQSESMDLGQVVNGVLAANRGLVEEAGHQLSAEIPTQVVPLHGDPVRLAQVVSNLLNNAVKYTPQGGLISVRLAVEGEQAVLRVADSGIGISKDMLARVFDLFTQVDQTYRRGTGGLGIGLNLAKRLVELHGGRIQALSPGQGQGSEFVVTLPLSSQQSAEAQAPAAGPSDSVLRSHRVLVVDDNVSIVESLRMLFDLMGQEFCCAHSGEEALKLIPSFRPELIILDIGMPGMSGYETCKQIRSLPGGRQITIVAMTGWAQEKDRNNSRLAGFNRHLVKPVDPDVLEELLQSLDRAKRADAM